MKNTTLKPASAGHRPHRFAVNENGLTALQQQVYDTILAIEKDRKDKPWFQVTVARIQERRPDLKAGSLTAVTEALQRRGLIIIHDRDWQGRKYGHRRFESVKPSKRDKSKEKYVEDRFLGHRERNVSGALLSREAESERYAGQRYENFKGVEWDSSAPLPIGHSGVRTQNVLAGGSNW